MKTKKSFISIIVIVVVILLACSYGIKNYNAMAAKEEGVKTAWSQVQNQYQRRADLIPNLVNTVKGYAAHEQETLQAVIEARAKATQVNTTPTGATPEQMQQYMQAQDGLSQALGKLMVVVERYPELKANENFKMLQVQLEGTENRIAVERNRFNEEAKGFNTFIRLFPRNIVAAITGFKARPYFEATAAAQEAPTVEF